jgi:hypothetical protein
MTTPIENETVKLEYTDVETLRQELFGRKIVRISETTSSAVVQAQVDAANQKLQDTWQAAFQQWVADGTPAGLEPKQPEDLNSYDLGLYSSGGRGDYDKVIEYHLDNGAVLRAHAADGGCGCSNGCFTVELDDENQRKLIGATILAVDLKEYTQEYRELTPAEVAERTLSDGTTRDVTIIKPWNSKKETPFGYVADTEIEPGSMRDGSSVIKLFVYTDLQQSTQLPNALVPADGVKHENLEVAVPLVTSEGGDNGYYGWGFSLSIERPKALVVPEARPALLAAEADRTVDGQ